MDRSPFRPQNNGAAKAGRARRSSVKTIRKVLCFRFVVFVMLSFVFGSPAASTQVNSQQMTATYTHRGLAVNIPYHCEHAGSGRLTVEILSPEDEVLGRTEHSVDVALGDGIWKPAVTTFNPLPFDELVWERVRYRFRYKGETTVSFEQVESVSAILRRPVVRILGQRSYLAGAQAAVRVIVSDGDGKPIAGSSIIKIELAMPDSTARELFSAKVDSRGTTEAGFRFPAGLMGDYSLHFVADTPIGTAETTESVRLEDKVQILLTTEKPIYQPSQTIHIRALALDRSDHKSTSGRELTFELEDSKGNKVFRKVMTTDAFGIASAEFALADEVNLGAYHLRALMGASAGSASGAPANTSEVTLQVERYVLPKFRVAIEFAKKDGKQQKDYRPGDHVVGTVRANYFFGKPVENAPITIKATGMDVTEFEVTNAAGYTDNEGTYNFDLILPDSFAGRPLQHGAASVVIEATVKDAAAHAEMRGESITVSQSPLLITAVPEGGKLVLGLENQVYILTSYPDGTPAQTTVNVRIAGEPNQKLETDKGGVAVVHMTPKERNAQLRVEADDHRGNRASSTERLQSRSGDEQVLLKTDLAVYKPGARMEVDVLSTQQHGTAYIDVVKDGQTILTRDVDLVEGRAELALNATPEMSGTVEINAYLFGSNAQPVADHRLVFVQPADELHIEAVADETIYKPGAEAHVHFRVTNAAHQGVSAALGLEVVDEAVFALAERQPGFAKVFFYLEQELMKPRYEIHSISSNEIVEPVSGEDFTQHDRAARVLFSAVETVNVHTLDTEFGRVLPQKNAEDFSARYRDAYTAYVRVLAAQLSHVASNHKDEELPQIFAGITQRPRDAWGTELRLEPLVTWQRTRGPQVYYRVISAGPDKRFGTEDDLSVNLEARTGTVYDQHARGSITLRMEHDRGPDNGLAEITGLVVDQSGAVVPGATISLAPLPNGTVRKSSSHADGMFTLAGLAAGRYELRIVSAGFDTVSRQIDLTPRDMAVLSSVLRVGAAMETVDAVDVEVNALPIMGRAMIAEKFAAAAPISRVAGVAGGMGMAVGNGLDIGAVTARRSVVNASAAVAPQAEEGHVRSYFPEAMYINPEVLTDGNGMADVTIPMADSITTWRMAMFASTKSGAVGTASSSLKVFQDFFVDLDLPITLTQGDRITIPVAIYNYTDKRGQVKLTLQDEDWFSMVGDKSKKGVDVEAGRVGESEFTIEAKRIGEFKLTLSARMNAGSERQDIVVREIEVVPNGQQQEIVFNGQLENNPQQPVRQTVSFPESAIPEASKIFVRLYPGALSQIVEGMDGVLRMPGGCFEQTSSSTYPNVLALDYMKRTKKLTPEVHAKAEGYIANGYQRLLTFEVPGGGFSWFGQAPANKILTAYGLMEFHDMSTVYDVDPRLITRTSEWLASQQKQDGSWKPDTQFINEGATNRYNSDVLRITAYVAWSLEAAGYQGPAVAKAKRYLVDHLEGKPDAYTLAVLANFAVDGEANSNTAEFTQRILRMLMDAHVEKGDQAWWSAEETGVYATGASANIETTGLAVQALLKAGQYPEVTRKALTWIISKKGAGGNWGTTQATIMALRALVLSSQSAGTDARGTVDVLLNGKHVETISLMQENSDLLQQLVLPGIAEAGANDVKLQFHGSGRMAYQVAGRYFVPWRAAPTEEPLSIDVMYDRTKLAQNDIVEATATVRNNLGRTAKMVMVDLGIPPGFDLLTEDLQAEVEKTTGAKTGRLEKFSLTATQAILYFDSVGAKETVKLRFRLRAKYPIRAKNFESRVYEYYDPAITAAVQPVQFEVTGR
jgi:uncharacterized protein YfaS (alpha-2-macroglobulin family)